MKVVQVFAVFLVMAIIIGGNSSATEEVTGTRRVLLDGPGSNSGTVTLKILFPFSEGKPNGLIVKETLPPGWAIARSTPSVETFNPETGEAKWLFMGVLPAEVTISYAVKIPPGDRGEPSLSGEVLYTGSDRSRRKAEIVQE